uniref:Uncharacterized protein n=1 Tax=Oryza punctata TaxID=4537 RepID=A0A0E0M3H4_ORYPU
MAQSKKPSCSIGLCRFRQREAAAMEGLIPFVFGVIKKRRKRPPCRYYQRLHSAGPGAAAGGAGVYQSQSCRFPDRAPADEELEFSYYDDGGCGRRRRASPEEGLSGEVSALAAGCNERGLSCRSLRFSSLRVLACVSGA